MKNFFIIFFVSLFICPALFSQGQNEFKYTKEMLKTDAMSAASEYEKLSLQEQQKTVPMCIFGKRYWNSTEDEYLLIAAGKGKSLDMMIAKQKAIMDCDRKLIAQFIYKNKTISALTKDSKDVITRMAINLVDVTDYNNDKYKLSSEDFSIKKNEESQQIYVYTYTCATPLKNYIADYGKDPLAVVYY